MFWQKCRWTSNQRKTKLLLFYSILWLPVFSFAHSHCYRWINCIVTQLRLVIPVFILQIQNLIGTYKSNKGRWWKLHCHFETDCSCQQRNVQHRTYQGLFTTSLFSKVKRTFYILHFCSYRRVIILFLFSKKVDF